MNCQIWIDTIHKDVTPAAKDCKIIASEWNLKLLIIWWILKITNLFNPLGPEKLRKLINSLWRGQDVLFLAIEIAEFEIEIVFPKFTFKFFFHWQHEEPRPVSWGHPLMQLYI